MKAPVALIPFALACAVAYAAAVSSPQIRMTPEEADAVHAHDAGAGTSGVAGIRTTVVAGDPTAAGPYTIRLSIPANTRIQAHTHRDDRTAVVAGGVWYFGYGSVADAAVEKALPPGSFYTEPAGVAHFAQTKAERVTLYITGTGPTDTLYIKAADTPAGR
ncbi:MAG: cupin domain-containing protein [Gammaproteobacteria bacterium]